MAVVTAASKPSVSNAVRRQTASSPVPLRAHAGFPNIVTNPRKPAFNAAKFAHAAQALDYDEHSDSCAAVLRNYTRHMGIATHNMQPCRNATAPYVASLVPHSGWPQRTANPYGAWWRATGHYVALRWQAVGYGRLHDRGGFYDAKGATCAT
ncbi:hypothetical protein JB92DRAFT_3103012 [Gautieria morchelliformis]|nr:hypothetical protein JB92DRAFT_3103012 [Gautieria morchelliformis]